MPRRRLPSPSMVVAIVAVVLATTGVAVAQVSSVGSSQIRNGSIQLQDLSKGLQKALSDGGSPPKSSVDYTDLSPKARSQLQDKSEQAANEAAALAVKQALPGTLAAAAAGLRAAAQQAAEEAVAGKQGPKGDAGPAGTMATYTTSASNVGLTTTTALASLSLPAGTWVLVAHLNAVNNDTASAERLDCYFTGTPDENDLAKVRAERNEAGNANAIFADVSLQATTTLGAATAVTATCAPSGPSPNWTFNSVKLTAVQTATVARQ